MSKEIENYKQQLFETAAEYGKAGRAAYEELAAHIDESLEHGANAREITKELGNPETAIRKILKADGKATYPFGKIFWSGVLLAIVLGVLAGASGLLMPPGSRIGGMTAISGDPDALPYSAARCVEYRQLVPSAPDCRQAAMLHHYYELTDQRLLFTIFCLFWLGVFVFALRRGLIHILPRKTMLLLGAGIYIALGGVIMALALGDLSAGRHWDWLGDFLTGVPMFIAGALLLAYYLGYISRPANPPS
jgi:hypothetical protein